MSISSSFESNKIKAEMLAALHAGIDAQLKNQMDTCRAREFWERMLINITPSMLAEAMTNSLEKAKLNKNHQ